MVSISYNQKIIGNEYINRRLEASGLRRRWYNNGEQVNVYDIMEEQCFSFYPASGTITFRHNGKIISRKGDIETVINACYTEDAYDELVYGNDDGEQLKLI